MIRAANHSFYPRVGESPLDQQLRTALRRRAAGKGSDAEVRAAEDEVATVSVADQSRAFVEVVTDGLVRWEGLLSHVSKHLEGVSLGPLRRWFATNQYDRRPVIEGEVSRTGPFLLHDYEVGFDIAQSPFKIVLPGAVTFARLADDRYYGDPAALAKAVAAALAVEVHDLAEAGARWFQLDEPMLCRNPGDVDLVVETAGTIFAAAGDGATTILSTYFGDLHGVADRLGELPGTHLGLDAIEDDRSLELLAKLPEGKGVHLGLFDARTSQAEDAEEVAQRLQPYRAELEKRDVMVGPQCGLDELPRDLAFDKLLQARYLVEKLQKEWTWA